MKVIAVLRRNALIIALLVAYVSLGLYYSVRTPLFEEPDETGHYTYVAYLIRGGGLPIQNLDHTGM